MEKRRIKIKNARKKGGGGQRDQEVPGTFSVHIGGSCPGEPGGLAIETLSSPLTMARQIFDPH